MIGEFVGFVSELKFGCLADFAQMSDRNLFVTPCFDNAARENQGLKSHEGSFFNFAVYTC